ncbi:hypothetical protein M514_06237 [Trichuris suis]|nr:hypothetical protein M514_06237 [Trichuris suis]
MLLFFHQAKTAAVNTRIFCNTVGEGTLSLTLYGKWFRHFRKEEFGVSDRPRSSCPKETQDDELEALLAENSAVSITEIAKTLGVHNSSVSRRLNAMGKIPNYGNWAPHELSASGKDKRHSICLSLLTQLIKQSFLF